MRWPLVNTVATLWLSLQFAAAMDDNLPELEPMPRHLWDRGLVTRQDDAAVGLAETEQLMWRSSEDMDDVSTVVSMVTHAKQDERILDMDKFEFLLDSVTCDDTIVLTFAHDLIFAAVKAGWEWVNYNDMRSFVLIPSWKVCSDDKSRDPWVVSGVQFDDKTKEVTLDAAKSTWKKVENTYILDFGEYRPSDMEIAKRAFDAELSEAFTVDLTRPIPDEVLSLQIEAEGVTASFGVKCADCGVRGAIRFTGHIEVSFGIPQQIRLTAVPSNLGLDLKPSFEWAGQGDLSELDGTVTSGSQELTPRIPLPGGWNVPGILTFGPNMQVSVGYSLLELKGQVAIEFPLAFNVPDDSSVEIDLGGDGSVGSITGWVPEFEMGEVTIAGEMSAKANVYIEAVAAVELDVLGNTGFGADIYVKAPDLGSTITTGVKRGGFCDDEGEETGMKFENAVGADLGVRGYHEYQGDQEQFLTYSFFNEPALLNETYCISWDIVEEG